MPENENRIRVRMYRQGLGDCFLISLLRDPPGRAFHLMIDCGVILGTPNAVERLQTVVRSVIAETGGRVDVLAVTHEHYDHVAGFLLARDLFAGPEESETDGRLVVGEVWFAWTEDPADALAAALRQERGSQLRALSAMALRLGAAATDANRPLTAALSFFGVAADGKGLGDTAQAMRNAAGLAPAGGIRYLAPGAVLTPAAAPELRIRVLGPPHDRARLRRTDSTSEVYRIDAEDLETSVRLAAGEVDTPTGGWSPFGPGWALPLSDLGSADNPRAGFFRRHYLDGPPGQPDQSWRRIDGAWLASSEALALALDGATNNTSLVLAIELAGSGKVLLFAADAQVGNWLSWQDLSWLDEAGRPVTAADLLGRTVFYKVGHHGSHNATLRAKGLELMPAQGLVGFMPVDHEMATKKGWGRMPLPALVDALRQRCGEDLVRIDEEPPDGIPGLSKGGDGVQYGSLYVDWTLPL